MTTRDPFSFVVFKEKTMFMPLRYIYGECWGLIEHHPQMFPLKCFVTDGCPVTANCGEIIVNRVNYLFEEVVPKVEIIVAYYKYRDRPKSIRGAIFNKNLDPPSISILNPYAFRKFIREGTAFQWFPTSEFLFMSGNKDIIPVEKLVL